MEFRILKGNKIREVREKKGKTLDQVVEDAGKLFTKGALSSWENGKYIPKDDLVPYLLNGLGCDWSDISEPKKLSLSA